jgi:hypothetical protein
MNAYLAEQARKVAEAKAIEDEKLALAQREAAMKGGEHTQELGTVEIPTEPPKHVRTELGTVGKAKIRKWEVVDKSQVPDEYKILDAGKITRLVKAGIGHIPGIRIYEDEVITVRTK